MPDKSQDDYLAALTFVQLALAECAANGWRVPRDVVDIERLALHYGKSGTDSQRGAIAEVLAALTPMFNF